MVFDMDNPPACSLKICTRTWPVEQAGYLQDLAANRIYTTRFRLIILLDIGFAVPNTRSEIMKYYIDKKLETTFEDALERVRAELAKEGFGVITEIDVKEILARKLKVDFRKYRILGACNPSFAYQALQAEDKIGIMLPCNVIVQELSDGKTEVAAVDPATTIETIANPALKEVAEEVRAGLRRVIEVL
jgi:uncharacterized protein (DUF302 family)